MHTDVRVQLYAYVLLAKVGWRTFPWLTENTLNSSFIRTFVTASSGGFQFKSRTVLVENSVVNRAQFNLLGDCLFRIHKLFQLKVF